MEILDSIVLKSGTSQKTKLKVFYVVEYKDWFEKGKLVWKKSTCPLVIKAMDNRQKN